MQSVTPMFRHCDSIYRFHDIAVQNTANRSQMHRPLFGCTMVMTSVSPTEFLGPLRYELLYYAIHHNHSGPCTLHKHLHRILQHSPFQQHSTSPRVCSQHTTCEHTLRVVGFSHPQFKEHCGPSYRMLPSALKIACSFVVLNLNPLSQQPTALPVRSQMHVRLDKITLSAGHSLQSFPCRS